MDQCVLQVAVLMVQQQVDQDDGSQGSSAQVCVYPGIGGIVSHLPYANSLRRKSWLIIIVV